MFHQQSQQLNLHQSALGCINNTKPHMQLTFADSASRHIRAAREAAHKNNSKNRTK
jgi:hypothetical protein